MPVSFIRQRTAVTYQGPGDIVSGATAWYGLRAYNAAYATGSNNAINVRRASDNTTSNIVILANGSLDIATANTFAGVDATASATTTGSSTTIALTSASSTPHVGSTFSVSGGPSLYIISVGTFVGGTGTIVVNVAQNIAVATPISMQYALFVTEVYDQTGNGWHLLQATAGNQPRLFPLLANSGTLPAIVSLASTNVVLTSSSNFTPATGLVSYSSVTLTTANAANGTFLENNAFHNRWTNTAGSGLWGLENNAGSGISASASNGTFHAASAVMNGASSVVNIDGTETTGTATGVTTAGVVAGFVGNANSATDYNAQGEAGFWDNVAFSSTQRTNLRTNLKAYWGTP